jgi:hypothetical protein
MLECFLNFPAVDHEHPFALDCDCTANARNEEATSMQSLASKPNRHGQCKMSPTANLICCIPGPNQPFKTRTPDAALNDVMQFCHFGVTPVVPRFCHPRPMNRIGDITHPCNTCQRCKLPGNRQRHLPPREADLPPWQEVAVDLIGPWTVKLHGQQCKFMALTSTDKVTN